MNGDGTPVSPQIIEDGSSPEKVIWNWFEYSTGSSAYPKNIFIDSEMKIYDIIEVDMPSEDVNTIINSMLAAATLGCTDATACNYDSNATLLDDSCKYTDDDSDGICNEDDLCPSNYDPYNTDRDGDGLYDACQDDNDDDPNNNPAGADCWNFALGEYPNTIFYDANNNILTADEVAALAALGTDSDGNPCSDQDLGIDNTFVNKFTLLDSYPNPFNPSTTIYFELDSPENIDLSIYDLNGSKIQTLINKFYLQGAHQVSWVPKSNISSGVYILSLESNQYKLNHKILYLK